MEPQILTNKENNTIITDKKILWVEDDLFLNNIIAQKLSGLQWKFLYALEGVSALKIAHEEKPDVIVLDIVLPGQDGLEILTQLKADEATKNIPVIMFSNLSDPAKIKQSKELGGESFFVKATTSLEAIIEEIQRVISR
jgi:PleD family two-component response regulator